VKRLILVRHAESVLGVEGIANGDPAVSNPLSAEGERQAQALGEVIAETPVDLCVTSEFERVRQTADLALAGRDVPRLVLADLNEIRYGKWEGAPVAEYLGWAWTHGPADPCPGGGEARVEAARRLVRGWRTVLARDEEAALAVGHGLALRYVLNAVRGRDPKAMLDQVPLAEPQLLSAAEIERGVARLEAWVEDPRW
jgi:broad specificity phosphatase PhoE